MPPSTLNRVNSPPQYSECQPVVQKVENVETTSLGEITIGWEILYLDILSNSEKMDI